MVLPPAKVEVLFSNIEELDDLDSRPYDFGFVNPIYHKGIEHGRQVDRYVSHQESFSIKAGNYQSSGFPVGHTLESLARQCRDSRLV